MSAISTNEFTERLTRMLQKADRDEVVVQSSGDAWGKYLIFRKGGHCIASCGWTRKEAMQIVRERCAGVDTVMDESGQSWPSN